MWDESIELKKISDFTGGFIGTLSIHFVARFFMSNSSSISQRDHPTRKPPICTIPHHPTTRNISALQLCLPSSFCHSRCVRARQAFDLALLAILQSHELIHSSSISDSLDPITDRPFGKSQVHPTSPLCLEAWLFLQGPADYPRSDSKISIVAGWCQRICGHKYRKTLRNA